MNPSLESLIAFCVLMENGGGILTKSPDYVLEKFASAFSSEFPAQLLDTGNLKKFNQWFADWKQSMTDD